MESILILDSDIRLTTRLVDHFTARGHVIEQAPTVAAALRKIELRHFDVVLADSATVGMQLNGLLQALRLRNATAAIIVMSEPQAVGDVIREASEGAADFIHKPVNLAELEARVARARAGVRLANERQVLRGDQDLVHRTTDIIGKSPAIRQALSLVEKVSRTSSSVILSGETGTGKELLAGAIHYGSARSANAFVRVNCATIPDTLLESELFGHERGAFTGAEKLRIGRFEQADGGSIFLDEIGDASLPIQAKLLRVLQEREFQRLGSNKTIWVDVRVISATARDLARETQEGRFRLDLYYRLNVVTIAVPPLREREGDILLLANHFLRRFALELKKRIAGFDPAATKLLTEYSWPGNIRELRNAVERAVILCETATVTPMDLNLPSPAPVGGEREEGGSPAVIIPPRGLKWEEVERDLVLQALRRCGWVQKEAARLLGLSTRVLNYKIQSMGITHPTWRQNR